MAYFPVQFSLNARMEALLGVLFNPDGTVYFNADDVAQFVPKSMHKSTVFKCRPIRRVRDRSKVSENYADDDHRDMLDTLRHLPWKISKAVTKTLEYGYFRDRSYDYNLNLNVVSSCEWGERVQFPQ